MLFLFSYQRTKLPKEMDSKTKINKDSQTDTFFEFIVDNSPLLLFVKDAEDLKYRYINKVCENALGVKREDFVGKKDHELFPEEIADEFVKDDLLALSTDEPIDIPRETLHTKDRGERIFHTRKYVAHDEENAAKYIIGISEDITERVRLEENILKQAREDSLTGLSNRTSLNEFIEKSISLSKRSKEEFSVIYLDLDNFKPVNDEHGHDLGDEVLVQVAQRLKETSREIDCVARVGGDEFIIVLFNLGSINEIKSYIDRIKDNICKPMKVEGMDLELTVSAGYSVYPSDGETLKTLISDADRMMYLAKKQRD